MSKKFLQAKQQRKKISECQNLQRQKKNLNKLYKRLTNVRENHLHQVTTEIVKLKPSKLVMENLNVMGMMKNRHLSEKIQEQNFFRFRQMMEYKCNKYNIKIVFADRWFPSSKTCSCCRHVKHDLKLKDRKYICSECGLVIDRDLNAAVNLANYGLRNNHYQD